LRRPVHPRAVADGRGSAEKGGRRHRLRLPGPHRRPRRAAQEGAGTVRQGQAGEMSIGMEVSALIPHLSLHLRQNAGVSTTSTVNSSSRPSSIVAVHTQVWKSESPEKLLAGPTWFRP